MVEVVYPPSIIPQQKVPAIIKQLATERNDVHRSRLVWSLVGMPIVAPFALVPLVPNVSTLRNLTDKALDVYTRHALDPILLPTVPSFLSLEGPRWRKTP